MANQLSKKLTSAAGLLLVIGIAVAVNVIASRFYGLRIDMTEEKLYSLSKGTRELVKGLNRDITLKFFWTQKNEEVPAMIQQYGQRVLDLLKEYDGTGKGRIVLEVFDPAPDTDEEELARKYGLTPRPTSPLGGGEFFCGVVAVSGKNEKNLAFLSPEEDSQLEYKLNRLISEVTTTSKPKLGVISSLPVMGSPAANPFMQRRQPTAQKWFFVQQLESQMEVQDLGTTVERIPDDIKTLVLVQPKGLSDKTQYAIDQFLLKGGRILGFLDPSCLADQQSQGPMPGMGGGPEITKLLNAWGVQFGSEEIAADTSLATKLSTPRKVSDFPSVLSLRKAQIDQHDIATANLENLMMPTAGFFKFGATTNGLTRTDLLKTTDKGATLSSFMAMGDDPDAMAKGMKPSGALSLAVKLTGKFPSAFPAGPPKAEGDAAAPAADHLKEASAEGVVILLADADMVDNRWCVDVQNFLGTMMVQPLNDNLNLVLNLVEYLGGNNALISLRSRGTYARPFTTIEKMEEKAKEKYQAEIDTFQKQFEEARRKLQEIQAGKAKDQKMILTKEAQAEIAKLQTQELDARKRTREIRKELRRDVEGTEKFLQFINVIGVPVGIGLFGLARGLSRRARATSK